MKRIYTAYSYFTGHDLETMSAADGLSCVRKDIPGVCWQYSHYIPETSEYVFDAVVEDDRVPDHPKIVLIEDAPPRKMKR